uniref:Uncharacterized protein n=1 Tax=Plectus sambesii TaxID=2011161 RepID=A0A914VNH7_9BILA
MCHQIGGERLLKVANDGARRERGAIDGRASGWSELKSAAAGRRSVSDGLFGGHKSAARSTSKRRRTERGHDGSPSSGDGCCRAGICTATDGHSSAPLGEALSSRGGQSDLICGSSVGRVMRVVGPMRRDDSTCCWPSIATMIETSPSENRPVEGRAGRTGRSRCDAATANPVQSGGGWGWRKMAFWPVPPRGLYAAPPPRTKFTTERRRRERDASARARAAIGRVAASANGEGGVFDSLRPAACILHERLPSDNRDAFQSAKP